MSLMKTIVLCINIIIVILIGIFSTPFSMISILIVGIASILPSLMDLKVIPPRSFATPYDNPLAKNHRAAHVKNNTHPDSGCSPDNRSPDNVPIINPHMHDKLTGLPNREAFFQVVQQTIDKTKNDDTTTFSVLVLDCDHFKTINNSLGHPVGDQLLKDIAQRLQSSLRTHDAVARLDGDEFAILLTSIHIDDISIPFIVAQRILNDLTRSFSLCNHEVYISASIGIVIGTTDYTQATEVQRDGTIALHQAKVMGRGRYAIFENTMRMQALTRMELGTDLRHAIEREELTVYYQPIVSLNTGTITGFEALVRWNHPQRGLLSPGKFLPIAEEVGMSATIDRWVLATACHQLSRWQKMLPASHALTMSVNINGKLLIESDMADYIDQILQETQLSPHALRLEITENTIIEKPEAVVVVLEYLQHRGVQVSLDDFGTGYSSLNYIHRLPINILKIDRSFINGLYSDQRITEVVRTIVALAHNLGMEVVAEGAETHDHLNHLRTLGCEYGQGFYFSVPVDLAQAEELLLKQTEQRKALPETFGQQTPLPHTQTTGMPLPERTQLALPLSETPPSETTTTLMLVSEEKANTQHNLTPTQPPEPPHPTDPLTGLLTRASLQETITSMFDKTSTRGNSFAIAVLDLDHFKSVNDAFGHARGDQILVEFAQRTRSITRSNDYIFRYGGDEFVLLLPETNRTHAATFSQRLLQAVRATPFDGDPALSLTISMGIAIYPDDSATPQELFEIADQRNYQAKRAGRGCAIYEDTPLVDAISTIESPSRMIERDHALEKLQAFLEEFITHERALLQVIGEQGTGISRFLEKAQDAAQLRGYTVLMLRGNPALKDRVYGVLTEAIAAWDLFPLPSSGIISFGNALQERATTSNNQGVIIILDDVRQIDHTTLQFLHNLFLSCGITRLAFIYATPSTEHIYNLPQEASLREQVNLARLSQAGVRIWLRHSLNWEVPNEVLEWFIHHTAGKPAAIHRGLHYIVNNKIIDTTAGAWNIQDDFASLPLAQHISEQSATPPHNLPIGHAQFVGRERDVQQVKHLIREHRLVTILGPGGLGKTRLAVQAAAETLDRFPDGVWQVSLASLSSSDFLVYTIIDALQITLEGPQAPKEQLLAHLRTKVLLLMLDSFEHVRDGASLLNDIIEYSPGVHVLVTSRDRLTLSGSVSFELGGLPYPEREDEKEIEHYSAVQLFLRTVWHTYPDFYPTAEDKPYIVRICRLLEGMPLGIELAAAWIRTFSCEAIASKIELNLAFLATDRPDIPERHRNLLAIIDSFWFLLSDYEQSMLRRLSIFRGGFSGGAARQIIGASPFFLDGLVAKGYLRWTPQKRYEIHELLRQYAVDKLNAAPLERDRALEQHSLYYLALVQNDDLTTSKSRQILHEISADIENVRSAWYWAVDRTRIAEIEACSDGLATFYDLKGMFHEADTTFDKAATHIQARFETKERSLRTGHRVVSMLLAHRARFLNRLAQYDHAISTARAIVELARTGDDQRSEATGFYQWGEALMQQGNYDEAWTQFEQAAHLAHLSNMPALEADSFRKLGRVSCAQGRYDESSKMTVQAFAICQKIGDRQRELRALNDFGILADSRGDYTVAKSAYEQCLSLAHDIGDLPGEGNALLNLGALASDQGNYAQAEAYLINALAIFQANGDRRNEGIARENLGDNVRMQGDTASARIYYEQTLRLCRDIGDRQGESFMLSNLGLLAHQRDNNHAARLLCEQALQIARTIGDTRACGNAMTYLGHALAALDKPEEAIDHYEHVVMQYASLHQSHLALDALAGLARVAMQQDNLVHALEYVSMILTHMQTESLDGTSEPFRIALSCYQVLHACDDSRAHNVFANAYNDLYAQAERIENDERKQLFLYCIPAHHQLIQEATRRGYEELVAPHNPR